MYSLRAERQAIPIIVVLLSHFASQVVSALLSTSAKKAALLAKSPSTSFPSSLFFSQPNGPRYLVYNLRKRDGDSADKYFKSTEMIAGVKDMRFQALMPDVLHWLGIQKVDNMVSMSDMYVSLPYHPSS